MDRADALKRNHGQGRSLTIEVAADARAMAGSPTGSANVGAEE
jgi:hypothetical protein